jgi:formate dehydrogenase maturation protein FdhE
MTDAIDTYSAQLNGKLPYSQEEYLARGGNQCPYCGSPHIEAGVMDAEGTDVYCEVSCHTCERSWTDFYSLVRYIPDEED